MSHKRCARRRQFSLVPIVALLTLSVMDSVDGREDWSDEHESDSDMPDSSSELEHDQVLKERAKVESGKEYGCSGH